MKDDSQLSGVSGLAIWRMVPFTEMEKIVSKEDPEEIKVTY